MNRVNLESWQESALAAAWEERNTPFRYVAAGRREGRSSWLMASMLAAYFTGWEPIVVCSTEQEARRIFAVARGEWGFPLETLSAGRALTGRLRGRTGHALGVDDLDISRMGPDTVEMLAQEFPFVPGPVRVTAERSSPTGRPLNEEEA
jgi:hypothetical protein